MISISMRAYGDIICTWLQSSLYTVFTQTSIAVQIKQLVIDWSLAVKMTAQLSGDDNKWQ